MSGRTARQAPEGVQPVRQVPVEALVPGEAQPRERFDAAALERLAASIRAQGVLQPILVRPLGPGRYEIVAGERRWRAARMAGLREVPVIALERDDAGAATAALVENLQREGLDPLEAAEGIARLMREHGMRQREVAEALGLSREHVAHLLRLLRLEPTARRLVAEGALTLGHAKVLAGLPRPRQRELALRAADRGWSVRRLERAAREGDGSAAAPPARRDPDLARLEARISEALAAPVSLAWDGRAGALTVRFFSLEELDGILERLGAADGG
ncbi:MAG TPA: ParB/RepB/Spo0J family partition protein [Polyangiaceae bacterium]|nr:ParB/RepB/Spo0J family partition protein [Polyangiaceae bacterium]